MRVIRRTTIDEIGAFLQRIGRGNFTDNFESLSGHTSYFFAEFEYQEFMTFVFLQNDEVVPIAPRGANRQLGLVAARAAQLGSQRLSANWDLGEVLRLTLEAPRETIRPLVLRSTRSSECAYGDWYIQDGSHTALGYAVALLLGRLAFQSVPAYCASTLRGA